MARERLSMRKVKEVLRLKSKGLSNRQIAASVKASHSTIGDYLSRAREAGIFWPLPEDLDDLALQKLLFGEEPREKLKKEPDFKYIHKELKKKGVTLKLLWEEYIGSNPGEYSYSQFCHLYRKFRRCLDPVMRHAHKAGEKTFIDYAGMTVPIVDRNTGEITQAQIFVAALGASNYTFAEATFSQELPNFIGSHTRAFAFFGGVTKVIVPDNPKTAVTKPCRYEPDVNATYFDMARHYNTAIIPTRPRKPKDKPKVESAVQVVEMWVLAPLRNRTFFSLGELNEAIAERLEILNNRLFQKLEGSRRELFEELEKGVLLPLPERPYEFATFKKATVNIDYHIDVEAHYYSVPYRLIGEKVDVRLTATTVEILYNSCRVASHKRSYKKGGYTTLKEHMPKSHQKHAEWTPSRMINWALKVGPKTAELVRKIIESKPHPEQGYRACLGIIRLSSRYGQARTEAACNRAIQTGAASFQSVKSILEKGLDRVPIEEAPVQLCIDHENVRGPAYYH